MVARPWDGGPAGEQVSRWLGGAVLVLLPGAVGIYVRTRAQLLAALRERAERAEAEQELLARDAVLTERTRIAREMHDAVGHRVSLMVLQAGAIEMAAADRQRVEQLAGQVQTAGRQALDELRQMVGVLRAGDDRRRAARPAARPRRPARARRRVAAGGHGRRAHRPARRRRRRPGGRAAPPTGSCRRRSPTPASTRPGAPVRVAVERPAEQLVVRVVNGAGAARRSRPPAAATGWWGWRERVRTLGGRLTAEPRLDGGFVVEAVLPA